MALDSVEAENVKLKEILNQRNQENEQLTTKILKQKSHYEDSISVLRKENDTIRGKLIEYERLFETEKETLKYKLSEMHESELTELKLSHQKYVECLQSEISKSEKIIQQKNTEIEQLIKEKASIRQMFDSEGNRYK